MKESNSPVVGALTLNYLSYGLLTIVNNLWSWLTAVTAAVGFRRVRALPPPEERNGCEDPASTSRPPPAVDSKKQLSRAVSKTTPYRDSEIAKVKFSVYYREDESAGVDERGEDVCTAAVKEKTGRWCEDWEGRIAARMGDFGWYACQDLTVLNGSVVRLWEASGRRRVANGVVW